MADLYRHGVYTEELSTTITPMIQVTSPTVAIGTAPVHLASNPATNKPVLCYSLAEFVEQFGWSDDFDKYTLCEAAHVHFQLYNVAPVVFINVFDMSKHVKKSTAEVAGVSNPVTLTAPIILPTLKVTTGEQPVSAAIIGVAGTEPITIPEEITGEFKLTSGNAVLIVPTDYSVSNGAVILTEAGLAKADGQLVFTTLTDTYAELQSGTDYVAAHDSDGNVTLTVVNTDKVVEDKIALSYDEADLSAVMASEIIGGVDLTTGANTGFELVEEVYPRLGVVPGTLIAPKYSSSSTVAAVLKAKADEINGVFKSVAVADLPGEDVRRYTDAASVKNVKNFVGDKLFACWPAVALEGVKTHLGTQLAALMCAVDADHEDIPVASPSNHNIQADQSILSDGTDIFLGKSQANYLNGQGIVTALNFAGGWRAWGSRTSAYPSTTDPKDSFIPCRRMMNWVSNSLILNYWSRIDMPINRRQIEGIVDEANLWLNGLTAKGVLLGGRIAFLESENPTTSLLGGKIKFHVYLGLITPAREIDFVQEMDVSYFSALFG